MAAHGYIVQDAPTSLADSEVHFLVIGTSASIWQYGVACVLLGRRPWRYVHVMPRSFALGSLFDLSVWECFGC